MLDQLLPLLGELVDQRPSASDLLRHLQHRQDAPVAIDRERGAGQKQNQAGAHERREPARA